MERVRKYVNCISDANMRARQYYMSTCEKYNQADQDRITEGSAIFQWPQMWGSTSCGFGGIGGAAMTEADTIVVEFSKIGLACVYHNGQFAYSCRLTQEYEDYLASRYLPGKADVDEGVVTLDVVDVYNTEKR